MAEAHRKKTKAEKSPAEKDDEEAKQRASPSGRVVYKAILHEADTELKRPSAALFWSGLAAGLSMGFSLVAEGLLRTYLPDAPWRPLVSKLGYSVGFLIVILGRQQLFTENTLTPMLPLMLRRDEKTIRNTFRLGGAVLAANMLGALIFAFAALKSSAFEPAVRANFIALGHQSMSIGPATALIKGIFAGWLIALIVWLLPFAESARLWVIIILTYIVGLAKLTHVVAGAVEVFVVAWAGQKPWLTVAGGYLLPTLIGNCIGGVMLVAALNHAQIVAGAKGDDV